MIDRETELAELRRLADRREPVIALLYGRRRVGKTYLLDHAFGERRVVYYLAADTSEAVNRRELLEALGQAAGRHLEPDDYPTWRAVVRAMVDAAAAEPLIVVLDEFQYLMGGADDIVSQLTAVWDREVDGRALMLVLCGSEVGTMSRLSGGDSPLYGRITWAARLRPFDYLDAGRMVAERSPRERAYIYGVLGGIPRYLSAVRSEWDLGQVVQELVLSPRGEVHLQLATVIQQEKGIREPGDYQAVLQAVAEGRTEMNEIVTAVGMQDRPYVVRRALEILEALFLIRRERNFGASPRTAWRNRVADPALGFWYRFVHRNRGRLERGDVVEVWETEVEPELDQYMGQHVFERMVAQAYARLHGSLGLPGASEWGRWEGRDRNRRSIEIDIIAGLDDGRLLTGEVKWTRGPVDTYIHYNLIRDLEDVAASGQGWARDALDPERSAGHLYVSAGGFTEHMHALAGHVPGIILLDLETLYF